MNYSLDKKGIAQIKAMMKKRTLHIVALLATEAFDYLLHFGYHATTGGGPDRRYGPGWSAYYAVNWNCGIGTPNLSVLLPERDVFNEKATAYLADLYEKDGTVNGAFDNATFGKQLFVTNSVYYGQWLNEGGVEFLTHNTESLPNRFIELCNAHLLGKVDELIKEIKEIT